jgi:hypothetical protein
LSVARRSAANSVSLKWFVGNKKSCTRALDANDGIFRPFRANTVQNGVAQWVIYELTGDTPANWDNSKCRPGRINCACRPRHTQLIQAYLCCRVCKHASRDKKWQLGTEGFGPKCRG